METAAVAMSKGTDVAFAKCECCGMTEECTEDYIKRITDRYSGRWICGLCSEAVNDELTRSEDRIGNEEALNQHMSFCRKFKTSSLTPPNNPTQDLICAVKQLMLKSLDSPRPSPTRESVKQLMLKSFDSPRPSPSPTREVKQLMFKSLVSPRPSPTTEVKQLTLKSLDLSCPSPTREPFSIRDVNCFPTLDS